MEAQYRPLNTLFVSLGLLCLASLIDRNVIQAEEVTDSGNSSTGFSGIQALNEVTCPASCPACPACSACPSEPACDRIVPPGYKYYEGLGYYKLHYEKRAWMDAKAACEREGADLIELNSQAEATLANSFIDKLGGGHVLVGFFDLSHKGEYITVEGDALSSTGFDSWYSGEPNNVGWENCGSYKESGINDMDCAETWPFVCELK